MRGEVVVRVELGATQMCGPAVVECRVGGAGEDVRVGEGSAAPAGGLDGEHAFEPSDVEQSLVDPPQPPRSEFGVAGKVARNPPTASFEHGHGVASLGEAGGRDRAPETAADDDRVSILVVGHAYTLPSSGWRLVPQRAPPLSPGRERRYRGTRLWRGRVRGDQGWLRNDGDGCRQFSRRPRDRDHR